MPQDDVIEVPAGAVIFSEGEPGSCAYLIERGSVAITVGPHGQDRIVAMRGVGEIFGEMAIIDGSPRSAGARALEDVQLQIITQERLAHRISGIDPVLRMLLDVLLSRLRASLLQVRKDPSLPLTATLPVPAPDHHRVGLEAIRLERDLDRAIRDQALTLHFQPIVNLRTFRPEGFEALVRWNHPERGWLPPDSFIPIAEASGLIGGLTRWCLAEASEVSSLLHADLLECGAAMPFIAVNVSSQDLLDPQFSSFLARTVGPERLARRQIKIEVTESILLDQPETARACLDTCRTLGVGVAIDDFGTGYSNLSYLHSLPISSLKIDRSFVMRLSQDDGGQKIIQTILRLADDLGIQSVAEGIEDLPVANQLADMGCTFGQGYYFARPLALGAALDWLRQSRHNDSDRIVARL